MWRTLCITGMHWYAGESENVAQCCKYSQGKVSRIFMPVLDVNQGKTQFQLNKETLAAGVNYGYALMVNPAL